VPLAGHGLRRTALRRRAGRPQLRRDPLGSRGTRHSAKSVRVLRTMSPNPLRVHLEGTRVYLRVAIAAFILPTGTAGSPLPLDAVQGGYLVVYGVKTVTPLLTPEQARQRGLPFGEIPKVHVTRLFAVEPLSGKTASVFSDEALPVMVLNREGGGETAVYGIVATNSSQRKAIALMGMRRGPGDPRRTSSLYELSLDGRNVVRKISDVESMIAFAVSRDGEQIAYFLYNPKRLVIRSTSSGKVGREVSLEGNEFAGLPSLSWSPDGRLVLVRRWPGPEHETQYDLIHLPEGRVERTGINGEIYSFFPKSNRVLGVHLIYDRSSASPLRQFFSMAFREREAVNLSLPPCRGSWHAEVSPDETLIAYPCDEKIVIRSLAQGDEPKGETTVAVGHAEVIGWIVK